MTTERKDRRGGLHINLRQVARFFHLTLITLLLLAPGALALLLAVEALRANSGLVIGGLVVIATIVSLAKSDVSEMIGLL